MANDTLKVGFVGWGKQAETHAEYLSAHEAVSVEAICGTRQVNKHISEQRLQKLKLVDTPIYFSDGDYAPTDITNLETMLEHHPDINALVISTPHAMHYPQAKFGLERKRGLHILVDKPLAITFDEARTLVDLAEQRNRVIVVANQRRYEDAYSYVGKQLHSGELGHIKSVNGILSHRRAWLHGWRTDLKLSGGGAILSIGHHLIDTLVWLVDDQAVEVNACASFLAGGGVENYVDALIRFKDGCSATMTINHGAPDSAVYERMQIWASNGNITVDRFKPLHDTEQPKVTHQNIDGTLLTTDFSTGVTMKWAPTQDFVEAILHGKCPTSSAAQNLETIKVIDAMYRSLRERRRVEL